MAAQKNKNSNKTRAGKSHLGHDPLAWLADNEPEEPVIAESATHAEEPVITKSVAQTEEPVITKSVAQTEEPVITESVAQTEEPVITEVVIHAEEPVNTDDTGCAIDLPSGFGIAQVEDYSERFKSQLATQESLQINAGEVGVIDAAALQLLLAVKKQADHDGKTIEWLSVSDKLRVSAHVINVAEQLGLTED